MLCAFAKSRGYFGANAAWYRLSLLTLNILQAMKIRALPAELEKARPKRLRFVLFTLAGRIDRDRDREGSTATASARDRPRPRPRGIDRDRVREGSTATASAKDRPRP
ncbi:MAG: hypothetical protein V2A73_16170, partial [Pseudomonadota bacterium]